MYVKKINKKKLILFRFCTDCIVTALRSGNKECPTCRTKLVSKRSLRADPNFDLLISKIYPNLEEYEANESRVLEKLNMSYGQANLVQAINEGIKLQTQNPNPIIKPKKNQHEELNESVSSITSNSLSQSRADNVTRAMVQTKMSTNIKSVMITGKEAGPASTVGTTDMRTDCASTSKDVSADEIELVFKPHPTEIVRDNHLIKCLKENSVRYIKTTANATGKLVKFNYIIAIKHKKSL